MKIVVGSLNPTKLAAVKNVVSVIFRGVTEVVGYQSNSNVANQPMSEDETYQGALNRAKDALQNTKNAIYGVGIEGGLAKKSYGWFESSIVVIIDRKGNIGVGSSGGLILPEMIISTILSGKTLEQAIDEEFNTQNIGKGRGMFGIMTNSYVTRTTGMEHGVAFAFARFLHADVFEK